MGLVSLTIIVYASVSDFMPARRGMKPEKKQVTLDMILLMGWQGQSTVWTME